MNNTQLNHPARLWLKDYIEQPGMTKTRASDELGISHKVLNALLEGNYAGNADNQLAKLDEQRKRISAIVRMNGVDLAHIPTEMMQRVWRAADSAKIAHLCILLAGKSQIGKTTACEAYKMRYPETTIFFRMPTMPTVSSMVCELLDAAGLPKARTLSEGLSLLREHVCARHLIIADEVHIALTRRQGVDALDALREIFDRSGCGLMLVLTDVGAQDVVKGTYAGRLAQLERRGEWEILPEWPSNRDIRAVWEAYGLPAPDMDTQRQIGALARRSCFGQFIHRLKLAAGDAQREARQLTWPDFIDAASRMARRPE